MGGRLIRPDALYAGKYTNPGMTSFLVLTTAVLLSFLPSLKLLEVLSGFN